MHYVLYLQWFKLYFTEVKYGDLQFVIGEEHSCLGRCGYDPAQVQCRCDPECVSFQDCCIDYNVTCASKHAEKHISSILKYNCVTLKETPIIDLTSVLLVEKCSRNWTSESIRKRCETSTNRLTELEDFKEFLTRWPVFDHQGRNYKNIFCALCNDNVFTKIQPWNVSFTPPTQAQKSDALHGCTTSTSSSFGHVGKRLRFCLPDMFSHCPSSETNTSLSSACLAYSAPICFVEKTVSGYTSQYRNIAYKNPHCAICNGFDLSAQDFTFCSGTHFLPIEETDSHVFLKSIWNFAASESKDALKDNECLNGHQIYDSYSQVCRSMFCLSDSTEPTCASSQVPNNIDDICCQTQESWILFNTITPKDTYLQDEVMPCFLGLLNISNDDIESKWEELRFLNRYFGYVMIQNKGTVCSLARDLNYVFKTLAKESSECGIENVEYFYMCEKFPHKNRYDKCDGNWYSGTANDFSRAYGKNIADIFIYENKTIIPQKVFNEIAYKRQERDSTFIKKQTVDVCGKETTLLKCPVIVLYPQEYRLSVSLDNQTILILGKASLKLIDYIKFEDGRLLICSESLGKTKPHVFSYSGYLDIVNSVGTCMSLFSVTVLFGLHCFISHLRNFHGKCIMSLSLALFFALLLPMISAKVSLSPNLCITFSILTHYMWLSTFTWMTIIGGNLFQLLIFKPLVKLEVRDKRITYRLVLPVLGWCIPLILVAMCIFLHSKNILLEYGANSPCWISDRNASLVVFGVPIGTCLGINVVLLITIIIASCLNRRRSCQMQNKQEYSVQTQDVLLWLKVII